MSQLWGGRFARETDRRVRALNDSLAFDRRLFREDITGSMAWAESLAAAGVLSVAEVETIVQGLRQVAAELEDGRFEVAPGDEDIHTAVERRLTELVGPVGGKLHTGRSRNDQVATDFRLWLMRSIDELLAELAELQTALLESAAAQPALPLPGYTHLQPAQPVTWGHWILSHFWPLHRDRERLQAARRAADEMPLGSGALAGTSFPVDRSALAARLGFSRISRNSLDAVSNRDFAVDFLYAATMIGLHLSRLAEQLILFASGEFGFVALDDAYSTGSSLMPQKKNPDTLELTRGKAGRLLGRLTGLLATLKALPSTYDKDLQEDKEPVFDARDTLGQLLPVMAGLIRSLELRPERMAARLAPELLATDLADYLVKRGLPFRQAHHLVGLAVRAAEARGLSLVSLPLADLRAISPEFEPDVAAVLTLDAALAARNVAGGTGPAAVADQLTAARRALEEVARSD